MFSRKGRCKIAAMPRTKLRTLLYSVTLAAVAVAIAATGLDDWRAHRALNQARAELAKPDRFEILTWHLLDRVQEATLTIQKHDTACEQERGEELDNDIARLEGRPQPHPRDTVRAAAKNRDRDIQSAERMAQDLLDSDDAIREHNRRHPDHQWAVTGDAVKIICGDCEKERAARNSAIEKATEESRR